MSTTYWSVRSLFAYRVIRHCGIYWLICNNCFICNDCLLQIATRVHVRKTSLDTFAQQRFTDQIAQPCTLGRVMWVATVSRLRDSAGGCTGCSEHLLGTQSFHRIRFLTLYLTRFHKFIYLCLFADLTGCLGNDSFQNRIFKLHLRNHWKPIWTEHGFHLPRQLLSSDWLIWLIVAATWTFHRLKWYLFYNKWSAFSKIWY